MAGSYRHVTDDNGNFAGTKLLDHMGDAHEALEEMHAMIGWLSHGNRSLIEEAANAVCRCQPPVRGNLCPSVMPGHQCQYRAGHAGPHQASGGGCRREWT